MATFPLADVDTKLVVGQSLKGSAYQLGGVRFEQVGPEKKQFFTTVGPIEFEEHDYGDEDDKSVVDTSATKVPVLMTTLSHGEYFDKYEYTPESAAAKLVERFPIALPGAIDKWIARTVANGTTNWGGFTGTPAPIDGSALSLLTPQDALAAAGYEPSLTVLTTQARTLVRTALNEDTSRSSLAVSIPDGASLGDSTVFFRNLYSGALEDGFALGQTLDPNFVKVFIGAPESVVVVTEETDHTLGRKNAIYAKVEIRIGIGADQAAVVPLVASLGS